MSSGQFGTLTEHLEKEMTQMQNLMTEMETRLQKTESTLQNLVHQTGHRRATPDDFFKEVVKKDISRDRRRIEEVEQKVESIREILHNQPEDVLIPHTVRTVAELKVIVDGLVGIVTSGPKKKDANPEKEAIAQDKPRSMYTCEFSTSHPYEVICSQCGETIADCDGTIASHLVGPHNCRR